MIESAGGDGSLLVGHDIADCIASLTGIEAHLGLGPQSGWRPPRFRQFARLFVSDRYLSKDLLRRWSPNRNGIELPRLNRLSVLSLLRRRLAGTAYEWPVGADAILFAANMRGFYVSPDQVTIKVKGPGRSAAEFREDVQARRRVAESGLVDVPAVLEADLSAAQPYVVDQFVAGRRAHWLKHRAILLNELVPRFWRMYQAFGTTLEPCQGWFDIAAITDDLRALPLDPGWTEELQCRGLLVRIMSSMAHHQDEALVCGFGHGDLSVGNLIVTPDAKLCVVDWELSRRQPIAWDFRKLLLHVPEVWDRLGVLLENEIRHQGWPDVMQPRRQLLLSLCAYVANWDTADGATGSGAGAPPRRSAVKTRAILSSVCRLVRQASLQFETAGLDAGRSA